VRSRRPTFRVGFAITKLGGSSVTRRAVHRFGTTIGSGALKWNTARNFVIARMRKSLNSTTDRA
jgi:hypothetical protein